MSHNTIAQAVVSLKSRSPASKLGVIEYTPFKTGRGGRFEAHLTGRYGWTYTQKKGDVCTPPNGATKAEIRKWFPPTCNPGDSFRVTIASVDMEAIESIPADRIVKAARKGHKKATKLYSGVKFTTPPVDNKVHLSELFA